MTERDDQTADALDRRADQLEAMRATPEQIQFWTGWDPRTDVPVARRIAHLLRRGT